MPKLSVIEAQGNESEPGSRSTPTQVPLRMSDVQRIRDQTTALSSRMLTAVSALGGLDWAAVALGRKMTYSSKLSEAFGGVDNRRPTIDVLLLILSQGGDEAAEVLRFLCCDVAGREMPRTKHVATDAEITAALRQEIDDTGPAGKALAERIAARLGVDVGSVKR